MKKGISMPVLSKLPPRERQIVDILYQRGPLAVAEVCDTLPDRLSGSAVRAMLKRLEDKGFVRRSDSERGYLYSPVVSDSVAKKSALSEIVRVFFNGSAASAATALLGMSDRLDKDELRRLEDMIAKARKAKGDD
jgi:predicted transcriptional regulator